MSDDPKCSRCGAPLRTVTVKVPVYSYYQKGTDDRPVQVLERYEEREEVADCIRCTGAY